MNEIKQLDRAYLKRFKQLNKNILESEDSGLLIFVEHLKYLRDIYILLQPTEATVTLNAAIGEFEAYKNTKKDFHWNNFCEFLKQNMKEWLAINDSV
jgi:hypothetical protein